MPTPTNDRPNGRRDLLSSLEEADILRALEDLTPALPEINAGPHRSIRYDLR